MLLKLFLRLFAWDRKTKTSKSHAREILVVVSLICVTIYSRRRGRDIGETRKIWISNSVLIAEYVCTAES